MFVKIIEYKISENATDTRILLYPNNPDLTDDWTAIGEVKCEVISPKRYSGDRYVSKAIMFSHLVKEFGFNKAFIDSIDKSLYDDLRTPRSVVILNSISIPEKHNTGKSYGSLLMEIFRNYVPLDVHVYLAVHPIQHQRLNEKQLFRFYEKFGFEKLRSWSNCPTVMVSKPYSILYKAWQDRPGIYIAGNTNYVESENGKELTMAQDIRIINQND